MSSLTLYLKHNKTTHYLQRHDELSGIVSVQYSLGKLRKKEAGEYISTMTHVVFASTPPSLETRQDRGPAEFAGGYMNTLGKQENGKNVAIEIDKKVFVKWATDKKRIAALLHEASIYSNELKRLQGTVVPRVIGCYTDGKSKPKMVCLVMGLLSGQKPADHKILYREILDLMAKLHRVGINHRQVSQLNLDHVVAGEGGLRLVDFSKAERHECVGCSLGKPEDAFMHTPGVTCCMELFNLEHTIGRFV